MNKVELRKLYLEKRRALTTSEYIDLSQKLTTNFLTNVDLSQVKVLHTFLSIVKNNEPDTMGIIQHVRANHPAIRIAIPKVNDAGEMESYFLKGDDQLKISSWGIPEPQSGVLVDPKEIDLVIVPLLIFDNQKHRVGYGKGFYDKFFTSCKVDCKKIGLSFFDPVEKIDDIGLHDLALDQVVTATKFYS